MLLHRFYDEDLAQASYLIGCQAENTAIVVDPRRDITDYLHFASQHGMDIVGVTETHIHADYLSGTRELAAATGAQIYVSGAGGTDWQYEFDGTRLQDRDTITIGNIILEARHTPGHTPEHLSLLITDGAFANTPGYMLSGDFVFSGDLGRPDLLDEAAGGVDTRFIGAKQLFHSLKNVLLELPDHVQIHPGHGSGSACGKALGALPSTTVGYERTYAWWAPYLDNNDEQGFIDELLSGQPDAHSYFGRMKRENKAGPVVLGYPLAPLPEFSSLELGAEISEGTKIIMDTRHHTEVHRGTVTGAVNVPGLAKSATYASWVFDPETDTGQLVILAADAAEAAAYRDHLMRVGIDEIAGFITSFEGLPMTIPPVLPQAELADHEHSMLLDLRNKTEHAAGHIPGSTQLSSGRVLWNLDQLPASGKPILAYCQSGVRNSVASSALRRRGYRVIELEGSYAGWLAHNPSTDRINIS